jgi:8-oxo-dGTP diphosphatase
MSSPEHLVACGLLLREGRALLVHRSPTKTWYPDVWDLPGGHIEPGESSGQALVRELREELGIEVALPVGRPALTLTSDDTVLDVWRVTGWRGTVFNAAPDEHDALGWFTPDELVSLDLADEVYVELVERTLGG